MKPLIYEQNTKECRFTNGPDRFWKSQDKDDFKFILAFLLSYHDNLSNLMFTRNQTFQIIFHDSLHVLVMKSISIITLSLVILLALQTSLLKAESLVICYIVSLMMRYKYSQN